MTWDVCSVDEMDTKRFYAIKMEVVWEVSPPVCVCVLVCDWCVWGGGWVGVYCYFVCTYY